MGKHRHRANYVTDKPLKDKIIIHGYSVFGYENHTGKPCQAVTRLLRHTRFRKDVGRHALVGDAIQRFNLAIEAERNSNPDDYGNAANKMGDTWFREHERDFRKTTQIHFQSRLLKDELCQRLLTEIKQKYNADPEFKMAFDTTAKEYLSRYVRRLEREKKPLPASFENDNAKQLSLNAIMEEYAAIMCLGLETKAHYFAYPDDEPIAFKHCREKILTLHCNGEPPIEWLKIKVTKQDRINSNQVKPAKSNTPSGPAKTNKAKKHVSAPVDIESDSHTPPVLLLAASPESTSSERVDSSSSSSPSRNSFESGSSKDRDDEDTAIVETTAKFAAELLDKGIGGDKVGEIAFGFFKAGKLSSSPPKEQNMPIQNGKKPSVAPAVPTTTKDKSRRNNSSLLFATSARQVQISGKPSNNISSNNVTSNNITTKQSIPLQSSQSPNN